LKDMPKNTNNKRISRRRILVNFTNEMIYVSGETVPRELSSIAMPIREVKFDAIVKGMQNYNYFGRNTGKTTDETPSYIFTGDNYTLQPGTVQVGEAEFFENEKTRMIRLFTRTSKKEDMHALNLEIVRHARKIKKVRQSYSLMR